MDNQVVGAPNQGGSILVVDDNPLIVNVVRSLLINEGYQVYFCANGREALGLLSTKNVDVILCDVMMPEMDGYQLHTSVRERPEHAHIPFIFLTGLNESEERLKGQESGADEYLVKPFDPKDLLSIVKGKVHRSFYLRTMAEHRYESFRKKVIHTLSHEFRTPLVAINTGTELLIDQKASLDDQKITHLLEAIRRGGKRLEKLVNDFMILQQIEAGIVERVYQGKARICLVDEIVEGILSRKEHYAETPFSLEAINNAPGTKIKIFDAHIHDVLGRLISNGIKFSPNNPTVTVVVCKLDKEVAFEVRDRGMGINGAKVQEAVDAFGQLDRDKLEQQGGGLGLAIASRLTQINRGRIEFDGREGGGTVVSVIFPIFEPENNS